MARELFEPRSVRTKSGHWYTGDVHKALELIGVPQKKKIDDFDYDIRHFLWCCEELTRKFDDLKRSIRQAPQDSTSLEETCYELLGEFAHLDYHKPRITRVLRRLKDRARSLPPLSEFTPDELDAKRAKKANDETQALWTKAEKKWGRRKGR